MDDLRLVQINAADRYLRQRRFNVSHIKKLSWKDVKRIIWLNSLYTNKR